MRGIRTAGAGLGLALAASAGFAQDPAGTAAPAARLGRIQAVDQPGTAPPGGLVVRGQASDPTRPPNPMPTLPVGAAQPIGGNQPGATLQMPRQLPAPNVTELRGPDASSPPAAAYGMTAPYGYGSPVVGQPIPVGAPVTVPSVLPNGPLACPPACGPDLDSPLYAGALGPTGLLTGPQRLHLDAEFLMWWVRSGRVPPLVTGSAPGFNGIIGQGDTHTLISDDFVSNTLHTGGRFSGVYWFGCDQCWGLDGNVWFLGRNGKEIVADSSQVPVLARPFFNLNQGIPFSEIVAAPGLAVGAVVVNTETQLWGAEANFRRYLGSNPCARLDLLVGFRNVNFNEGLAITEHFARTAGSPVSIGVPDALSGAVTDQFRTENHFYGAQVGLAGEVRRGRWFAEGRATVAMGDVFQFVRIGGSQQIQFANGPGVFPGGLLALPGANIGTFSQNKFAVVPEVGLKIGYHITPNVRVAVGYNFLYLSSVLRPGDQIDPGLDVTRIANFPLPGTIPPLQAVRPTVPMKDAAVFAQGISFSLQFNW